MTKDPPDIVTIPRACEVYPLNDRDKQARRVYAQILAASELHNIASADDEEYEGEWYQIGVIFQRLRREWKLN